VGRRPDLEPTMGWEAFQAVTNAMIPMDASRPLDHSTHVRQENPWRTIDVNPDITAGRGAATTHWTMRMRGQ